jgi:hypothetical protein
VRDDLAPIGDLLDDFALSAAGVRFEDDSRLSHRVQSPRMRFVVEDARTRRHAQMQTEFDAVGILVRIPAMCEVGVR